MGSYIMFVQIMAFTTDSKNYLLYYCSTGKLNSVDQRKNTEKVQFVQPRLFNSLKSDISGTSLSNPIEHDTSNQIRIE